ncbi:MAG: hypothetical protein QXX08_03510 [Candidatus Bathyarchaeia archaeon]
MIDNLKIDTKFLSCIKKEKDAWKINAAGLYYRDLNFLLRSLNNNGVRKIEIQNVQGQRYLGTGLENMEIDIYGTPGNDLGAFMNSSTLLVHGNVQDGCGNTMNDGRIIVHGRAGDIAGYSMRGGKIFIRDDVGYRAGIHMKEYCEKRPCLVIGGTAQDFLGEYMAGGVLMVLGLNLRKGEPHRARFVGTGMHGGIMYIRGEVTHMGKEVAVKDVDEDDMNLIENLTKEFCGYFNFDLNEIMDEKFIKIVPVSHRPYGTLYAY